MYLTIVSFHYWFGALSSFRMAKHLPRVFGQISDLCVPGPDHPFLCIVTILIWPLVLTGGFIIQRFALVPVKDPETI